MQGFTAAEIQTSETSIFVRASGSGPPILLLCGSAPTRGTRWGGSRARANRRRREPVFATTD
jgi:hypothetical protein